MNYKETYEKIIKQKGLKTCPFCGKGVVVNVSGLGRPFLDTGCLVLRHRDQKTPCVFFLLERIAEREDDVIEFLEQWNRRA